MTTERSVRLIELRVEGIDCSECAQHLERSLSRLAGVSSAQVLPAAGKALIHVQPQGVDMEAVQRVVAAEGCSLAPPASGPASPQLLQIASPSRPATSAVGRATPGRLPSPNFRRSVLGLLGLVVAGVVVTVIVGEVLGLFDLLERVVPWPLGWAIVILGGFPVLRETVMALFRRRVTSSTMMTVGAVAALVSGHWPVGLVVMAFMRVSDYVERFTSERGRQAVRELLQLVPQNARVERGGEEVEISAADVQAGEVVVVRPGEKIPVDGKVLSGQATVDQASITGESMPVEVTQGQQVFAATIAELGSLRVKTTRVGSDSTFGRVVRMVEEAEAHRAGVQRLADRFASWYLPVVLVLAALTYLIRRDPLATVSVLVVACSCSLALATPIAILASVGAAARRGLLVKGGKYLELLARADTVLLDKTGTLTYGQPRITDVVPLNGLDEAKLLALAASAERYSEHPLAEAVRRRAAELDLAVPSPSDFRAMPGTGVAAEVNGSRIAVGSGRLNGASGHAEAERLRAEGKTLLYVTRDETPVGILAAADTVRPEVPEALRELRQLGIGHIELLTGDNERVAAALAGELGVRYRANLLPEQKIERVRELQVQGRRVMMVGDGVNDAPALAQADVGIAMGTAGSDVAIEAAHLALMRDDWRLVPDAVRIARRTMTTVKLNLGFTVVYNLVGLALASIGLLPPVLAAAAQSLPDFVIVGNSSRLLRRHQAVEHPHRLLRRGPLGERSRRGFQLRQQRHHRRPSRADDHSPVAR